MNHENQPSALPPDSGNDSTGAESPAAAKAEPYFVLIEHGDGGPHVIRAFKTEQERKDATARAIFGTLAEVDDEVWVAYLGLLESDGSLTFEGDPGLDWMTAFIDGPLTEGTPAPVGNVSQNDPKPQAALPAGSTPTPSKEAIALLDELMAMLTFKNNEKHTDEEAKAEVTALFERHFASLKAQLTASLATEQRLREHHQRDEKLIVQRTDEIRALREELKEAKETLAIVRQARIDQGKQHRATLQSWMDAAIEEQAKVTALEAQLARCETSVVSDQARGNATKAEGGHDADKDGGPSAKLTILQLRNRLHEVTECLKEANGSFHGSPKSQRRIDRCLEKEARYAAAKAEGSPQLSDVVNQPPASPPSAPPAALAERVREAMRNLSSARFNLCGGGGSPHTINPTALHNERNCVEHINRAERTLAAILPLLPSQAGVKTD